MKYKRAFWFITVMISLLVLYSIICLVVLPVTTYNQSAESTEIVSKNLAKPKGNVNKKHKKVDKNISEEETPDSLKERKLEAFAKLIDLRKEENFIQSRMSLVRKDSMYLVLDLLKKTADLELRGVSLHKCNILHSFVNNIIKDQSIENRLEWCGEPFTLIHEDSTIPKVSWIIKYAPKDTTEANQFEELPKPPKRGDVYVVMDFDRNLRLIIQQSDYPGWQGRKKISALKWKYRKQEIIKSLNALIHFKPEKATPTIKIVLSKDDASILYRALPYKPKLVLRLS